MTRAGNNRLTTCQAYPPGLHTRLLLSPYQVNKLYSPATQLTSSKETQYKIERMSTHTAGKCGDAVGYH
jgi:hypothetical protein